MFLPATVKNTFYVISYDYNEQTLVTIYKEIESDIDPAENIVVVFLQPFSVFFLFTLRLKLTICM